MQPGESAPRPALTSVRELARLLESRIFDPALPEAEVLRRCTEAQHLGVAVVTVSPSDLDAAARLIGDSSIVLATVIDAGGGATPAVKQYAARDALRRGARLIEVGLNRGRMHSRHFQHVESELRQVADACREKSAAFAVSLQPWAENAEELDILTARVARRTGVDALCTTDLNHAQKLLELSRQTYTVVLDCGEPPIEDVLAAHEAGCSRVAVRNAAGVLRAFAPAMPAAGC